MADCLARGPRVTAIPEHPLRPGRRGPTACDGPWFVFLRHRPAQGPWRSTVMRPPASKQARPRPLLSSAKRWHGFSAVHAPTSPGPARVRWDMPVSRRRVAHAAEPCDLLAPASERSVVSDRTTSCQTILVCSNLCQSTPESDVSVRICDCEETEVGCPRFEQVSASRVPGRSYMWITQEQVESR